MNHLIWQKKSRREIFKTKIFTLDELTSQSPQGETGVYTVMTAPDWVVVVPVLETVAGRAFVMVRQWRHGAQELSLEFPGGVSERNETAEQSAERELREETGYRPGTLRKLGVMSPNPAIMANRVHFFLAQDLQNLGRQELDADEYVDRELIPVEQAIHTMGQAPYIHALMASALLLYLQTEKALIP
ncbi:MAG: NUDIX hydrolase [Treponema sp.]|jgi:8-oxo-dGTP pyrophosphatase MutT (NUDIX family)|nr:NUDIX hydrolase [Treponema sp.]